MIMRNQVILLPYNDSWSDLYREEVYRIQNILEQNFLIAYHIGSTSVSELISKPTIDLLVVVRDIMQVNTCDDGMISLGYEAKGEYGIPFRRYFSKQGTFPS